MSKSIALFISQWPDLSLAELAPLIKKMGYDGIELACWNAAAFDAAFSKKKS